MQKTFSLYSQPLLLGQIYDTSLSQIDSFFAEEDILYGQPVMLGNQTRLVPSSIINSAAQPGIPMIETVLPWAEGGSYIGIALRADIVPVGSELTTSNQTNYVTDLTIAPDQYSVGAPLRVMRIGRVVVMVDTASADASATNVAYYAGKILNAAEAPADSAVLGTFLMPVVTGQLNILQVNKII